MAVVSPLEPSCSYLAQSARSSPSRLAKHDGDAASETSSVYSGENSDRKEADVLMFSARSEEYRLLFRLPPDEVLVQDFNCALQENILLQGHMYLFVHHICFYSNIFGFETKKTIPFHEVTCVRKAKTAAIFPNAIEIAAAGKKYFFGSFLSRDEAYRLIVDSWAQHVGDARSTLYSQDLKSETSIEDIANALAEKERGTKDFADDLSSSGRKKDVDSGDCTHLPTEKADSSLSENRVEQSNTKEENAEGHSGHASSQCEDIVPPKVPETFTIVAQAKFSVSVEEFFNLFISDQASDFVDSFHKRCGDKDFNCSSWRQNEQFVYVRDVSFLHPVKIYLGAKYGRCHEIQKYHAYKKSHLVIETSQQITDVPYADYFLVEDIANYDALLVRSRILEEQNKELEAENERMREAAAWPPLAEREIRHLYSNAEFEGLMQRSAQGAAKHALDVLRRAGLLKEEGERILAPHVLPELFAPVDGLGDIDDLRRELDDRRSPGGGSVHSSEEADEP